MTDDPLMGAVFLCNDCGAIFVIGPNNLMFMGRYSCYNPDCESYNVTRRPDLRDQVMIDNTGKIIRPIPKKAETMPADEKIPVWVRTTNPDGTTEGHEEEWDKSILTGATLTDLGELTLSDGRIVNFYAGEDEEIGYTLEIDNGDPALIARLQKEREDRNKEYCRLHPDEDPANFPRPVNCRYYVTYKLVRS